MSNRSTLLLPFSVVVLISACAVTLFAADATTEPATQPTSQPTSAPASQPSAPIAATDKDAIEKATDSLATVTGTVAQSRWITSGTIMFIDFSGNKRGAFTAIIKEANRPALDKAFNGDVAAALDLKKISVTGKIVKYKGTPQIEITTPDQITLLPATPTTTPTTAPTTAP